MSDNVPAVANSSAPSVTADFLTPALQAAEGRAFQSIAQSVAISIQDAVDNLRNVETISTTAIGVAMAQYLATQNPVYQDVIKQAQGLMGSAIDNYTAIGKAAAGIATDMTAAFKG